MIKIGMAAVLACVMSLAVAEEQVDQDTMLDIENAWVISIVSERNCRLESSSAEFSCRINLRS